MSMQTNDAAVAQALAESVRKVGPDLGGQPRRVQAMLSDVLGGTARTHRTEIDAVVLTAEEGIPGDLTHGRLDERGVLERLRARGLDDELAHFAVDAWRYAFGMRGADALPPTLPASPTGAPGPAQREPATAEPTVLPYWPAGTPGGPGSGQRPLHPAGYHPGGSYGSEATATPPRRRPLWTSLVATAALIAVISLIALIANEYMRSEPTNSSPAADQGAVITGASATVQPSQPSQSQAQPSQSQAQPPQSQSQPPSQRTQPSQATQPSQSGSPSTQRAPSSRPSTPANPAPAPAVNKQPTKGNDPTFTARKTCSGSVENWYIYVLDQFSDPDGDALQITSATASEGTAQVAAYGSRPSTIRWFEPDVEFSGSATVNFTVADGRGGTSSGILTITVPDQCR